MLKIILGLTVSIVSSLLIRDERRTVWLIGDSTMAKKETAAFPETGWGMPFSYFFDSTIRVENRARNGRSTRTFMEEALWKAVQENLKEGDYVFIQFGHNDEVPSKASYTAPDKFVANLVLFVQQTRGKKAIPVLCTPVARRKFDSTGKIIGTHDQYSALMRMVAEKHQVPLIDLDRKAQDLIQQLGVEASVHLFNHLRPLQHPNYPEGKMDDTHFSELGARKIAQIVAGEIRKLKLDLAGHLAGPAQKN